MEIILYSNKQILGGFVLIFLIGLLFVVNLTLSNTLSNNYNGINLSYFVGPLIFTICMLSLLYISSLKKSIQLTKDKYTLPDNLSNIIIPCAIITADSDKLHGLKDVESIADRIPNSKMIKVPSNQYAHEADFLKEIEDFHESI